MTDWNDYPLWDDTTTYRRTITVAQQNPAAADSNAGTADAPLLTINAAAQLAEPGDRVVIHSGVYREQINPARGGCGRDSMISYEAAPGSQPIISGS